MSLCLKYATVLIERYSPEGRPPRLYFLQQSSKLNNKLTRQDHTASPKTKDAFVAKKMIK